MADTAAPTQLSPSLCHLGVTRTGLVEALSQSPAVLVVCPPQPYRAQTTDSTLHPFSSTRGACSWRPTLETAGGLLPSTPRTRCLPHCRGWAGQSLRAQLRPDAVPQLANDTVRTPPNPGGCPTEPRRTQMWRFSCESETLGSNGAAPSVGYRGDAQYSIFGRLRRKCLFPPSGRPPIPSWRAKGGKKCSNCVA